MSNLFKKVTSTVGAIAIAVSAVSSTLTVQAANTFAPYADALATAGIIGKQSSEAGYRLGDSVTRAEMAKIAVNIKGATVTEATGKVFSDVTPALGDLAKYIEAAANAGLVSKTNAKFRPLDLVTRAEALKMLLNANGIAPTDVDAGFKDIGNIGDLAGYVNAAAAAGIINKGTSFNPNNTATRGESFKIASNSAGLTTSAVEDTTGGDDLNLGDLFGDTTPTTTATGSVTTPTATGSVTTPAAAGTLEVSLAANTPGAMTAPKGVSGVKVASFDLTAGSADVTVSSVKIKRQGVGSRSDIESVYLYNGSTKLSNGRTISSDTNIAEFNSVNLVVKAGSTVTLNVVADVAYAASASNQHQFGINVATDLTTTASTLKGTFPMNGNLVTVGGSTVSGLLVQTNGTPANPTIGDKAAELAKVKLTAGTNNVSLKQLTLTNKGNLNASYLTNLQLLQGSTVVASASGMTGDKAVFVLATPFEIKNGEEKTFTMKGDLVGGRNSDTVEFTVQDRGDVVGFDTVLNSNAYVDDSSISAASSFSTVTFGALTVKGGDVTVTFAGPAAQNVSRGGSDVVIWKGTLSSSSASEVKNTYVYLATANTTAARGLCKDSSTANYTDIKLKNLDTGSTIAGPAELTCTTALSDGSTLVYQITLTDDYNLAAGKVYNVGITTDIRSDMAAGDITATLGYNGGSVFSTSTTSTADSEIKRVDSTDYVKNSQIVPSSPLAGNKQTVVASSLTVNVASVPVSQTYVKGGAGKDLLGLSLQAGTNSDVKITQLKIDGDAGTATTDIDGTVAETPGTDVRAANVVTKVYLYDGATLIATKSFDSTSDVATFDNLSISVAAGATKTLTVKGDINSSLSSTTYFAANIASANIATYVTSEDKDGRDITEVVGTSFPNIGASWALTKTALTMSPTGGTLTLTKDADTPTSTLAMMGTTKKEVLRAKLAATTEDFRVERLSFINDTLTNTSGDQDNNVSAVYMEYPTATSTATVQGTLNGGIVTFDITSAPAIVKKDSDARIKIYVDFNTYSGGATSGEMVQFYTNLADFKAYGQGSNVQKDGAGVLLDAAGSAGAVAGVAAGTAFAFGGTDISELNGAVATTTTTSVIVDGSTNYKIGDIIYVDTEEMIVTANLAAAGTLSVLRGANGTTAATHADNADITKLGTLTTVATAVTNQAMTTTLAGLVASANINRGDLLGDAATGGSTNASKATFVATTNQLSGVTAALSIVTTAASSSKLTGVSNTAAITATDDMQRIANYRVVAGNVFSAARSNSTLTVAAGSASGTATTKAKDNILTVTATNGGSFAATLSAATVQIAGSLIHATNGDQSVTVTVYDNAALDTSSVVGTAAVSGVDAGTSTATAITFSKTVEVASNSTKTLYLVVDTTDTDFATTTSDDLLTASVTAYSWSDGVATFVAADTGYGLTVPVNGNTLRY